MAAVAGMWVASAWTARSDAPAAFLAGDILVAAALVASYAGACAVSVSLSRGPARLAVFRVVVLTLVILACLAILEAPALFGFIDYRRQWDGLTGNWRGPDREYQLDYERAFRRIPNVHMVGRPQGDIAGRFNVPIRSPRSLEFTFNAHGYRGRVDREAAEVALVGDSFIEGWYVSDGETCAERLESKVGR